MSQQGDYTNQGSEPWANRRRGIPLRTYSGKIKYAAPPSRRHFWKVEDVERILARLVKPDTEDADSWTRRTIVILRRATLFMMERLMFFLDSETVKQIYEWAIALLDKIFAQGLDGEGEKESTARRIILYVADKAGLSVTIKSD